MGCSALADVLDAPSVRALAQRLDDRRLGVVEDRAEALPLQLTRWPSDATYLYVCDLGWVELPPP